MILAIAGPALLMGLFGSAHCAAMCGGIVSTLSCALPAPVRARPMRQLPFALAYNFGRITSYALAGAFAGSVGAMAATVFDLHGIQAALRLGAGALTIGVGLFVAGLFPSFAALERLGGPLWSIVAPYARKLLPVQTLSHAALLGALWGFLPCGMVYVALTMALGAGSPEGGALAMAAFGLGTLPALVAASVLASAVARVARRTWLRRGAAVALVGFGLLNVSVASAMLRANASDASGRAACCAHGHGHGHGGPSPTP